MACAGRGCVGQDICNAARICCVAITQGCGTGCSGLAAGTARIQVNAQGNLEVCRFVGGACQCTPIQSDTSVFTDVPDTSTFTHTAGGVTTTVDLCVKIGNCNLSALQDVTYAVGGPPSGVNNCLIFSPLTNLWQPAPCPGNDVSTLTDVPNTGTFTHVAGGVTTTIDLCAKIGNCNLSALQDVTYAVGGPPSGVNNCLIFSPLTNLWQPTPCPVADVSTLVDNAGTPNITHTAGGVVTVIDVCAKIRANCTDTLVFDPATNNFVHTAVNGTVQNIPRCPGVGAIQNRLPTANDDGCNTSGAGVLCPGSSFVYDGSLAGADVAANGACRRNFVNRGTNACGGAIWEEICQPVGPNQLQVGLNAPFNAPSNVLTVMQWQQQVTADPTGAVTYDPATGAFTINCPGQYEIHSSIMGPFQPYVSVIGQDNIEFVINTRINGAASRRLGQEFFRGNEGGNTFPAVTGSGQYRLNTGDTLEILFFHNHNAALALQPLTNNDQHFTIRKTGC